MGSVFKNIGAILSVFNIFVLPVLIVSALVATAFGGSFEEHMKEHIGFVFGLWGLNGEDVISTNVSDQRLLEDDQLNLMSRVALIHQQTQLGIIDIIKQNTLGIVTKYGSYFRYGRDTHYSGLPTSDMTLQEFPAADVVTVINSAYSVSSELTYKRIGTPTKEEYTYATLYITHQYNATLNTLIHLTYTWNIDSITYNYGTNNYDIVISRLDTVPDPDIMVYDTLSIVAYDPVSYLVARWIEIGNTDENYWVYRTGSGNVLLDGAATTQTQNLDMLPIIEIRNNGVSLNSTPTDNKYLQAKEILNIIGMDIDMLTDSVESNPDIANIMDAFIYFGLDVSDTSPTVAKMLYKIFDYAFIDASNNPVDTIADLSNKYRINTREGNFNSTLAWSNQSRTEVVGTIGTIGTYTSSTLGSNLYLRCQVTPNIYVEYVVFDIFTIVGISRGGMTGVVTNTLLAGSVIVPLSYFLIDQFSPIEQLELFGKSLRLGVYAAEITHLAFYETAAFSTAVQIIMFAITVVLSIMSGGSYLAIAGKILIGIATSYAVKKILETNSPMWLKAVGVIVALAIGGYAAGSVDAGEFLSPQQIAEIVTNYSSSVYDTVVTGISIGTSALDMYTNMKMEDLLIAMQAFAVMSKEASDKISAAVEGSNPYLSTEFVQKLLATDEVTGYIEGYALNRYKAGPILYDQVQLTVSGMYDNIFDFYTKAYKIGIIDVPNN